jgi:multidrug transporter EmrE-like cation transporter
MDAPPRPQTFRLCEFWVYFAGNPMRNALFLASYLVFVTAANVLLKESAEAGSGWLFYVLLVAGNLAGFVGILAYTGLLRTLPLHRAFPLSRGLVVLGILATSLIFFHETLKATEVAGVVLVTAGIALVGMDSPRRAAAPGHESGGAAGGSPGNGPGAPTDAPGAPTNAPGAPTNAPGAPVC